MKSSPPSFPPEGCQQEEQPTVSRSDLLVRKGPVDSSLLGEGDSPQSRKKIYEAISNPSRSSDPSDSSPNPKDPKKASAYSSPPSDLPEAALCFKKAGESLLRISSPPLSSSPLRSSIPSARAQEPSRSPSSLRAEEFIAETREHLKNAEKNLEWLRVSRPPKEPDSQSVKPTQKPELKSSAEELLNEAKMALKRTQSRSSKPQKG